MSFFFIEVKVALCVCGGNLFVESCGTEDGLI